MDFKLLGKRVRQARGNLSLRQFALKCGISHTHLDTIEKGNDFRNNKEANITIITLEKIANASGIKISELIGEEPINLTTINNAIKYDLVVEENSNNNKPHSAHAYENRPIDNPLQSEDKNYFIIHKKDGSHKKIYVSDENIDKIESIIQLLQIKEEK